MAADVVEPLLQQISELAPRFGRAREDLETMVTRGRAQDYKGVLQNARLVLEALLRSMVTEELKQTPGKAMLDELVTKFRQQANAGIIPTNVLAHMGTVQAWGNLSAHDHAGSLEDSGVRVGQQEVVASLNSMVAILTWYAAKKNLQAGGSARSLEPVTSAPPPSVPAPKSRAPLAIGGGLMAVVIGVAVAMLNRPAPAPSNPFEKLDGMYASWDVPVPPAECRKAAEADRLARAGLQVDQLSLMTELWPEAAYFKARALYEREKAGGNAPSEELASAVKQANGCEKFAGALLLAGQLAIKAGDLSGARAQLDAAVAAAPTWLEPRNSRAGVLLKLKETDAAAAELEAILKARPDYAPAIFLRSFVRSDPAEARADLCKAISLGSQSARDFASRTNVQCQ